MANYTVSEPQRKEDGTFLVSLLSEDGTVLAEGEGTSQEESRSGCKIQTLIKKKNHKNARLHYKRNQKNLQQSH